jgi:hypothetical protein
MLLWMLPTMPAMQKIAPLWILIVGWVSWFFGLVVSKRKICDREGRTQKNQTEQFA